MQFGDDKLTRMNELQSELEGQSDRAAAIVGVAWVEEELEAAIKSFLQKDEKAWARLFSSSGPLGTLSSKIDLACLLGMATKVITSDLHILRQVRNDFAHSITTKDNLPLSFNSQHIQDKCLALKCVAHESISEPRTAFTRACAILNSDFYLLRFFDVKVSSTQVFAKAEKGYQST